MRPSRGGEFAGGRDRAAFVRRTGLPSADRPARRLVRRRIILAPHLFEIATSFERPMKKFSVAIGSDHAGFKYKEAIKAWLLAAGHTVRDYGTDSEQPCDYPDFIRPVAEAVARGDFQRGIVLGGSGNGEAMVANHVRGVRCGLCWNEQV